MGKFTGDSKKLLEYVGGRENIAAVSHCVTRMRFVLNDPSKADTEAIESLSSAKGTFTQAGQFQVIIGNEVSTFYNDFAEVAGIEGVSKEAVKKAAMQNQTLIQRIMSSLAEIFAPLIPAIIVGGLILGFRNIIGEIALFDGGTKTLTRYLYSGLVSTASCGLSARPYSISCLCALSGPSPRRWERPRPWESFWESHWCRPSC